MNRELSFQTFNSVWAADTPNKLNITDTEIDQGIQYQSLIVSNQVNGALFKMSNALRALQLSGGYWVNGQRYFVGMFIKLVVIETGVNIPSVKFYQCINDDNNVGIVDRFPYRVVNSFTDSNGIRVYSVDSANLDTAYWRVLNGDEAVMRNFVNDEVAKLKAYINTNIANIRTEVNNTISRFRTEMNNLITTTRNQFQAQINSLRDNWKNLGTLRGGTFNFSFAGANNDFNCFYVNLTASTKFGTCTWTGARERSGVFLITGGASHVASKFFTNVYTSFSTQPWFPIPTNSSNGSKIWLFYKVHPTYGVCFTRG